MKYVNLYFNKRGLKFFYNKITKKNKTQSFLMKTNLISNLLLVFLKKGYKEKVFSWFSEISNNLYKLIFSKHSNFVYSNELFFNLSINNFHLNFNFLLSWIFKVINFCFFYSISNLPNIFKKKQKSQVSYKLRFFKKTSKHNLLVKLLFFKSLSLNLNFLRTKLYFSILDFILNYKNSWIYLFKVFFYKKLFKL